jgi:hypothetical protein
MRHLSLGCELHFYKCFLLSLCFIACDGLANTRVISILINSSFCELNFMLVADQILPKLLTPRKRMRGPVVQNFIMLFYVCLGILKEPCEHICFYYVMKCKHF